MPTRQHRRYSQRERPKVSTAGGSQKSLELSWISHHEAAHAVACLRLRPGSGSGVTIVPSGSTLGVASCEDAFSTGQIDQRTSEFIPDVRVVEAVIVELLAGRLGAISAGCPTSAAKVAARSDDDKVADLLQFTPRTRSSLRKKAMRFVEREWKAISAVAQELLQHGTLDDVEIELVADLTRPQEAQAELVSYRQIRSPRRPT